jgi:protein involved in polysaccharide export with SLBB domain
MRKLNSTMSIVFICVAALAFKVAGAQTAEQLQRLENLTPAQRAALLDALQEPTVAEQPDVSMPEIVQAREIASPMSGGLQTDVSSEAGDYPTLGELPRFGYDLFAGEPTTFAPATDIPIPVDYVVGPGDTVELQLFGSQSGLYSLVVGRDGLLNVPEIGPLSVSGLKFSEMTDVLQQRISEQMIGVRASITMGPLRSIRVFVLGDAYRPGSYTVSALSTMTNALFVSGGINDIGSLRRIQLKRNGRTVTTLDLYDLLLSGDTSGDVRLQPGDVIFVPPVEKSVGVGGQVRRPAIYELDGEASISDVLRLAGGMLPSAYPDASQISRISADRERIIVDVDLSTNVGLATTVSADDLVTVFSVLDKRSDVVVLHGHVFRPGPYQWRPGMRITDLIGSINDVRAKADLGYAMIRRENADNQQISILSANIQGALRAPASAENVELQALDQVTVFDLEADRAEFVEPVLQELRLQATSGNPASEVRVSGHVRAPGSFPLEDGMRVTDLIRAAGDLRESAYSVEAELMRQEVAPDQQRGTRLVTIDLASALSGNETADLLLQPHDILNIKEIPQWRDIEVISVDGEVRFPGNYTIRRGERLSSVIERAGGLTDLAFAEGAVFLRDELRLRERQQLAELAERLEGEIESLAAANPEADEAIEARRALLDQVGETRPTGRLVIDLEGILSGSLREDADVALRGDDQLFVPRVSQTVTIIGEVQFPTSHIHEAGISRDDYINRSGGMTGEADKRRIYVVRADGSVVASQRSMFFRARNTGDIRPGDTIVVPIKPDPVSNLSLWTSITTILYNIGVAAAAVSSFN